MKKPILLFILLGAAFTLFAAGDSSAVVQQASFNVDSATEHWLNTVSGAARAKSDAYFEGGYWLQLWGTVYAVLVAGIFMLTGLSRRMKAWVSRFGNVNLQNAAFGLLYFVLAYILTFPLQVYQGFFREHQYALSNMSFGSWFKDEMIGLAVGAIGGSLILAVVYFAMRRTGKNWWIWATGITMAFATFLVFIAPVFLSPLFNKYEPLADGPLKQQILSLARANGIPAENVYEYDASRQSDRVSANVSGFGATTRISLNDNLLKRCTPAEIRSVMGHEMGHYVMHHVYKGLVETLVLVVILFWLVNFAFERIKNRFGERLGVTDIADITSLPLLAVLFTLVLFLATPITNSMTRMQEAEADLFGLNAAREPDGEAHVDMMLSEYRKIDPGYWEEVIFYDHPSGRNRVHMAMQWKAEHLNDCK